MRMLYSGWYTTTWKNAVICFYLNKLFFLNIFSRVAEACGRPMLLLPGLIITTISNPGFNDRKNSEHASLRTRRILFLSTAFLEKFFPTGKPRRVNLFLVSRYFIEIPLAAPKNPFAYTAEKSACFLSLWSFGSIETSSYIASFLRPFCLRLLITFVPPLVAILLRNPWRLFRLPFFGWYVRFILLFHV